MNVAETCQWSTSVHRCGSAPALRLWRAAHLLNGSQEGGDGVDGGGCRICKVLLQDVAGRSRQRVAPERGACTPLVGWRRRRDRRQGCWQAAKRISQAQQRRGEGSALDGVEGQEKRAKGEMWGCASRREAGSTASQGAAPSPQASSAPRLPAALQHAALWAGQQTHQSWGGCCAGPCALAGICAPWSWGAGRSRPG